MSEQKEKIALYVRVSKDEKQDDERYQNPENQLLPLRKYAEAMNWEIVAEYIDQKSGASANRPNFRQMFRDAAQKKFTGVLVWALDRFTREGIMMTLAYTRQLKDFGVWLRSYQEQWLDTKAATTELILACMAWAAENERLRIAERTKAGISAKKANGTYRGGKPKRCLKCGWQHSPKKPCKDKEGKEIVALEEVKPADPTNPIKEGVTPQMAELIK